jgi:hypothetical protein
VISDSGRLFNHEEGKTYDPRRRVPPIGYLDKAVKESQFHVTACKMKYMHEEYADKHLIFGKTHWNSAEAKCTEKISSIIEHPDVILNST